MRWFCIVLILGLALGQDQRAEIRALKSIAIVQEKMDAGRIIVRVWSAKVANNTALAQRCLTAYRKVYRVVLCFVYDNPRAQVSDGLPMSQGGTSSSCWRYSTTLVLSGEVSNSTQAPGVLQAFSCPRP